jgi:hypothetical protein
VLIDGGFPADKGECRELIHQIKHGAAGLDAFISPSRQSQSQTGSRCAFAIKWIVI